MYCCGILDVSRSSPGSGNMWLFVPVSAAQSQWKGKGRREGKMQMGSVHLVKWYIYREINTGTGTPHVLHLITLHRFVFWQTEGMTLHQKKKCNSLYCSDLKLKLQYLFCCCFSPLTIIVYFCSVFVCLFFSVSFHYTVLQYSSTR